MAKQVYETFASSEVPEAMMVEAATLFNENYGTWGEKSLKPGYPVHLSARRLRKQYLPDTSLSFYTSVTVDGVLAGNAFSCRWNHAGKTVCWVTQLVVRKEYRERGLAGGLLRALKGDNDDMYGIMSSHPAACLAAAAAFSTTIEKVSLDFISKNAQGVMGVSPIPYIRDAKLCGTIFDVNDSTGLISGVDTSFFVNHKEPFEALEIIRKSLEWPFGDLPDGHEYLLIVPAKIRPSASRSSTRPSNVVLSHGCIHTVDFDEKTVRARNTSTMAAGMLPGYHSAAEYHFCEQEADAISRTAAYHRKDYGLAVIWFSDREHTDIRCP
ncbi:hypothetical protein MY11210_001828 [Beauveria gryllotalpidicola]